MFGEVVAVRSLGFILWFFAIGNQDVGFHLKYDRLIFLNPFT